MLPATEPDPTLPQAGAQVTPVPDERLLVALAARTTEAPLARRPDWRQAFERVFLIPDGASYDALSQAPLGGELVGADSMSLLQVVELAPVRALAVVRDEPQGGGPLRAVRLLRPILDGQLDFVCPLYARHKWEGLVSTGIQYPLVRCLFGKAMRRPMESEFAISRRLALDLHRDRDWESDPAHAGSDTWMAAKALAGDYGVAQVRVGNRPAAASGEDLSAALARVADQLFREMERHAATWQRSFNHLPSPDLGETMVSSEGIPAPVVASMLNAFRLGHQELLPIWRLALPPATLLALQRIARLPEADFAMDDSLWARILYDFSLGYHARVMDRGQLLRAMTPLYLGWAASFVNQTKDLDFAAVERRVESLCAAFASSKPYLISRWRWPDSFNP